MLLPYFFFPGTGLETRATVRSFPFGIDVPLTENDSSWKELSIRNIKNLISSGQTEKRIQAGYSSWIHPVEKTDSTPHFFYRHSAIPLLVFEDDRICEPVIIEIDHE